jgi:glycosyltransferase 2 family protein
LKSHLFRWVKIALTILVLCLLLAKVKPETILDAFAKIEIDWLMLAVLLGVAMVLLRWLKWHLLVRSGLGGAEGSQTLASLLGGMAIAIVTPARVGELSRVAFLKNGARIEASGLVLVDRFIDLSVVLIFASVGIYLMLGNGELLLMLLPPAIILLLLIAIFKLDLFLRLGSSFIPVKRLREMVASASLGLGRLSNSVLAINLGLTFLMTALDLISLYVLVRSLGATNFKAVAFAYPLIMLTNLAPITISGLGIRETTSVMLFTKFFAIPSAIAFNATFLSYLLNSLTPALLGIYFFRRLN